MSAEKCPVCKGSGRIETKNTEPFIFYPDMKA